MCYLHTDPLLAGFKSGLRNRAVFCNSSVLGSIGQNAMKQSRHIRSVNGGHNWVLYSTELVTCM